MRESEFAISVSSTPEGACNAPLQRLRALLLAYRFAGIVGARCMGLNGEIGMIGGVAPCSDYAGRGVHGTDVGLRQFC
jgi:hypothetical protein